MAAKALEQARALAPMLKAIADPHRLAILLLLSEQPRSVRELQEALELGQTLVSHHLRALREQGLVVAQPQGRSNVYELCCGGLVDQVRDLAGLVPEAGAV